MRFHPEIPVVLIELAAIGSHYAFPELPHTLGLIVLWGGVAGFCCGLFHLYGDSF
jgi:hypothetical protein